MSKRCNKCTKSCSRKCCLEIVDQPELIGCAIVIHVRGCPPPTIQWQISQDNGTSWTDIPGATSNTLNYTSLLLTCSTLFRAIVSNSCKTLISVSISPVINTTYNITSTLGTPTPGVGYTVSTGIQTNRVRRDGIVSTCNSPKLYPGFVAGTFTYDTYTFTQCVDSCVSIALAHIANSSSFSVAYIPSYDPNNQILNYAGDPGVGTFVNPTVFSVNVLAGQTLVVVIVNPDITEFNTYNLIVSGLFNPNMTCNPPVAPVITAPDAKRPSNNLDRD